MSTVTKRPKTRSGAKQRPLRRLLFSALLIAFVAGPLIGWGYEQYAVKRDAKRFPPPGHFIAVSGDRRLHYACDGRGDPLVVFEVSGFSNSTSFAEARSGVSRQTRVCSYDRVGIGWSDRGPSRIPVSMLADDLGALLDELSPRTPVILVASSIGGLTAEFFARQHPERIAGLVFLDAANSEAMHQRLANQTFTMLASGACSVIPTAGAVGVLRLLDPWHMRDATEGPAAALMYGAKPWRMLCAMVRARDATVSELDAAPPLSREIPLTALSAESREELLPPALAGWVDLKGFVAALHETHRHLAQRSLHGTWRTVPGSTHLIASSQPQAVIDAVTEMVRLSGKPSTP